MFHQDPFQPMKDHRLFDNTKKSTFYLSVSIELLEDMTESRCEFSFTSPPKRRET